MSRDNIFFGNTSRLNTLNRHVFVHDNPVSYIDPQGEFVPVLAAGAVVGGAINLGSAILSDVSTGEISFSRGTVYLNSFTTGAAAGAVAVLLAPEVIGLSLITKGGLKLVGDTGVSAIQMYGETGSVNFKNAVINGVTSNFRLPKFGLGRRLEEVITDVFSGSLGNIAGNIAQSSSKAWLKTPFQSKEGCGK